ncbi:Dephospho-CoA kinase [Diplonema papillatum]|nr:Dephospho-CoA kinase [Diplonema papillatum]
MVQVIGLTGGIACGKSTVSACLKNTPGVVVVDADEISRNSMQTGTALQKRVAKEFGCYEGVVNEDGSINRARLGDVVFKDRKLKKKLASLTSTPIFLGMVAAICKAVFFSSADVVVLDVPLLFETQIFAWISEQTVVVHLPEEEQLRRICARDHFTVSQAKSRVSNQMPAAARLSKATHVFDNSGPKEEVPHKVAELLVEIRKRATLMTPLRILFAVTCVVIAIAVGFVWSMMA